MFWSCVRVATLRKKTKQPRSGLKSRSVALTGLLEVLASNDHRGQLWWTELLLRGGETVLCSDGRVVAQQQAL